MSWCVAYVLLVYYKYINSEFQQMGSLSLSFVIEMTRPNQAHRFPNVYRSVNQ